MPDSGATLEKAIEPTVMVIASPLCFLRHLHRQVIYAAVGVDEEDLAGFDSRSIEQIRSEPGRGSTLRAERNALMQHQRRVKDRHNRKQSARTGIAFFREHVRMPGAKDKDFPAAENDAGHLLRRSAEEIALSLQHSSLQLQHCIEVRLNSVIHKKNSLIHDVTKTRSDCQESLCSS